MHSIKLTLWLQITWVVYKGTGLQEETVEYYAARKSHSETWEGKLPVTVVWGGNLHKLPSCNCLSSSRQNNTTLDRVMIKGHNDFLHCYIMKHDLSSCLLKNKGTKEQVKVFIVFKLITTLSLCWFNAKMNVITSDNTKYPDKPLDISAQNKHVAYNNKTIRSVNAIIIVLHTIISS